LKSKQWSNRHEISCGCVAIGRKFTVQTLYGHFWILIKGYDTYPLINRRIIRPFKGKIKKTSFKIFSVERFCAAIEGNALKFAAMVELILVIWFLVAFFKLG